MFHCLSSSVAYRYQPCDIFLVSLFSAYIVVTKIFLGFVFVNEAPRSQKRSLSCMLHTFVFNFVLHIVYIIRTAKHDIFIVSPFSDNI